MFEVQVYYSVIGAHPNLMSCDPRVLIPNYRSPKYHWGSPGLQQVQDAKTPKKGGGSLGTFLKGGFGDTDYEKQMLKPEPVLNNPANLQVQKTFFQSKPTGKCVRQNLEWIININRYLSQGKKPRSLTSYSFPHSSRKEFSNGQIVEKDYAGLISNIYFSYAEFENIVVNSAKTYTEIYDAIFKVLSDASDGYWDLALVESQTGVLTIVDKNYSNPANFKKSGEIYDFSYYDADNIIKSLKFRPQLSTAQATRVIYGRVNNTGSAYVQSDKNDLLDYKYRDVVVLPEDESDREVEGRTRRDKIKEAKGNLQAIQVVNAGNDGTLQMTVATENTQFKKTVSEKVDVTVKVGGKTTKTHRHVLIPVPEDFEIVKLVIPASHKNFATTVVDDGDDNNPRYCAIQPGITIELVLEGIGGLRTFQYFRIRNLPKPYSHEEVIFRIVDVVQSINGTIWETTIKAGLIPLRKYIQQQLGITDVPAKPKKTS
jgi:hypothetical protein